MDELCKQFTLVWFRDFCEFNSTELNRKEREERRERGLKKGKKEENKKSLSKF